MYAGAVGSVAVGLDLVDATVVAMQDALLKP
jgi:hypothetical protein